MAAAMLYVLLLVSAPGAGAAARAPRARMHALVTLPTDLHVHGQQTTALLITPATSSSSSDSAPSGIDEHTAHCASGIVPNNHTIKTPAAHVDYATSASVPLTIPATSSSSSQSEPSGIDEHTAHCASSIVPNNHTIKTPAAHVDYATIVPMPVTRLPDITAHVFTSGSQPGAS